MSDFGVNPEDRFSRVAAHLFNEQSTNLSLNRPKRQALKEISKL